MRRTARARRIAARGDARPPAFAGLSGRYAGCIAGAVMKGCQGRIYRLEEDQLAHDRVLVVAAHPDDETIGLGGRLSRLGKAMFVHLTDGAPRDLTCQPASRFATREAYARARADEIEAAFELAGIAAAERHCLGLPENEAALELATLARDLANLIDVVDPVQVITHPYEGGHPDHDAAAFAVHAAVRLLSRRGRNRPTIVEMTSYHACGGRMRTCDFLPHRRRHVATCVLAEEGRSLKKQLFDAYASQRELLEMFPVEIERFRVAPSYDFRRPPHPGPLWYERSARGMAAAAWTELAEQALVDLDARSWR